MQLRSRCRRPRRRRRRPARCAHSAFCGLCTCQRGRVSLPCQHALRVRERVRRTECTPPRSCERDKAASALLLLLGSRARCATSVWTLPAGWRRGTAGERTRRRTRPRWGEEEEGGAHRGWRSLRGLSFWWWASGWSVAVAAMLESPVECRLFEWTAEVDEEGEGASASWRSGVVVACEVAELSTGMPGSIPKE